MGPQALLVPPLLDLTTAGEADELLRKCLLMPGVRLEIRHQGATMDRLKALALENVAQLPVPHWELVHSTKDAALFEALEKRFPKPKEQEAGEGAENSFVTERQNYDLGNRRQAERRAILARSIGCCGSCLH